MRFKIKLSQNKITVPFDYQHKLVGTIHKWLGKNDEHGKQSVFSFSQLQGGEVVKNGFNFSRGSALYFSSTNNGLLTRVYKGIKTDPTLFSGLKVNEINILQEPIFKNRNRFLLLSPLLFKQRVDEGEDKVKHFTFEDEETDILLTEAVKRRLEFNGISDDTLKITFDKTYQGKKTKLINYKGINNKVSVCPLIIEGKLEAMEFLWNNGVGHSTGIGFGCLK